MMSVFPIVEGHGEVNAVPLLLRRIAEEICGRFDINVLPPHRMPRGRMVTEDGSHLIKAVELGVRKISQVGGSGSVLVLLDADKDCPAQLAPSLFQRISRRDIETLVVMAKREYEAWFLAAAVSLRRHRNVAATAIPPESAEAIENAKKHLQQHILKAGTYYRETVDQTALTAIFDLQEARAAPSFDKLCRDLERLLRRPENH